MREAKQTAAWHLQRKLSTRGFCIRATPYSAPGGWQTAGVIEKASDSGVREHHFVRAEKHPSREEAAAFTIAKARQIIDERGERVFGRG